MRIAIAGASGLLGRAVGRHLITFGHDVLPLVRRDAGPGERSWDPIAGTIEGAGLADVDAVINFSGAGIADARWSEERKEELRRSRLASTATLVSHLTAQGRCRQLLNGSAVGFYGDTGTEVVDERSPAGDDFLARLVVAWEAAASAAPVEVALLRTGHVLTGDGGFLGKQLLPFKLGLGGRLGSGQQFLPWIHVEDYVLAVRFVLETGLTGPVNLVGPNPVDNATMTAALGRRLNRPTLVPIPLVALRALFGSDMVENALLTGQRVVPARLIEEGFTFEHPELNQALASLDL